MEFGCVHANYLDFFFLAFGFYEKSQMFPYFIYYNKINLINK